MAGGSPHRRVEPAKRRTQASRLGPPLGTLLAAFSQNTLIYNCSFLASSACRVSARLTVTERRRREWPEAPLRPFHALITLPPGPVLLRVYVLHEVGARA